MLTKHYTLITYGFSLCWPSEGGCAVICPVSQVRKPGTSRSTPRTQGSAQYHPAPQPPTCLPGLFQLPTTGGEKLFQVSMTQESLIGPAGITWLPFLTSITVVEGMEYSHWLAWVTSTHFCDTEGQEWGSVVDRFPKAQKKWMRNDEFYILGLFPGQSDAYSKWAPQWMCQSVREGMRGRGND